MNRAALNAVADLGDVAALLPATVAIAIALVLARRSREALAWSVAVTSCMVATFALKAVCAAGFEVWGERFELRGFPSGHAAMAVSFYGTLSVLLWRLCGRHRFAVLLCALPGTVGAMVIIAVWQLKWHCASDLVGGAVLGTMALGVVCFLGACAAPSKNITVSVGLTAALAIALLHGAQLEYRPHQSTIILRGFPFLPKIIFIKDNGNLNYYMARSA